jgi:dipeptidyl aminopeptidase/acylaminoacyl peptidase
VWPDFDEDRNRILQARSALMFVDDLQTPLLILHGGADRTVSPLDSLRLATELQKRGREYELHVFAGDNHVLKANQAERDRYIAGWFRKHELAH